MLHNKLSQIFPSFGHFHPDSFSMFTENAQRFMNEHPQTYQLKVPQFHLPRSLRSLSPHRKE